MLRKSAHHNAGAAELIEKTIGCGRPDQPEQRRSSYDLQSGSGEHRINPTHVRLKALAHRLCPCVVRQRDLADRNRGAGHRPRSERCCQSRRNLWLRQRKAQPQSGQPEELAERPEHYDAVARDLAAHACVERSYVHERFVYDQEAVAMPSRMKEIEQLSLTEDAPVRIVRVRQHRKVDVPELADVPDFGYLVAGQRSSPAELRISRTKHCGPPPPHQRCDRRQQNLRAGRRDDVVSRRSAIDLGRNRAQPINRGRFRQPRKQVRRQGR